jgi:hypothetical protein
VSRNLLVQAVKATGVPHMEALDGGAAVEASQKWQPTHGRFVDLLVVRRDPVANGFDAVASSPRYRVTRQVWVRGSTKTPQFPTMLHHGLHRRLRPS